MTVSFGSTRLPTPPCPALHVRPGHHLTAAGRGVVARIHRRWDEVGARGALVFDVDGTVTHRERVVPDAMASLLVRLLESGVRVGLVSGMPDDRLRWQVVAPLARAGAWASGVPGLRLYASGGRSRLRDPDVGFEAAYARRYRLPDETPEVVREALARLGLSRAPLLPASDCLGSEEAARRLPATGLIVQSAPDRGVTGVFVRLPRGRDLRGALVDAIEEASPEVAAQVRFYAADATELQLLHRDGSKADAVHDLVTASGLDPALVCYVGDEFVPDGNDEEVARDPRLGEVETLSVGASASGSRVKHAVGAGVEATRQLLEELLRLPRDRTATGFYRALSDALLTSDEILDEAALLSLLTRKIESLGGRPSDLLGTLAFVVKHLERFTGPALAPYPGITELDTHQIYRLFADRARVLHGLVSRISWRPEERLLVLGSDAEHLLPALERFTGRRAGALWLNRSRLMSEEEHATLRALEAEVIGPDGFTRETRPDIPGFHKVSFWHDNALVNSTLFQISRLAMHTERYGGGCFEARFATGLRIELDEGTLQQERLAGPGPATLFGTATNESDAVIRREIARDGFRKRVLAIVEELWVTHLREHPIVRIVDTGTTGLQQLMLYGGLAYLRDVGREGGERLGRLSPAQHEIARELQVADRRLRLSLLGDDLGAAWRGVTTGGDFEVVSTDRETGLDDLVERFHSLVSGPSPEAGPSSPVEQAVAFYVSLVIQRVFLEGAIAP